MSRAVAFAIIALAVGSPHFVKADVSISSCRYIFWALKQIGPNNVAVPPRPIGDAWIATDSPHFAYRIWADSGEKATRPTSVWFAAGFDGTSLWFGSQFDVLARVDLQFSRSHNLGPVEPTVWERRDTSITHNSFQRLKLFDAVRGWAKEGEHNLAPFDSVCSLHNLVFRLGTSDLTQLPPILQAVSAHKLAKPIAIDQSAVRLPYFPKTAKDAAWYQYWDEARAKNRTGGDWRYCFCVDNEKPCIAFCRVRHVSEGWFGRWPYPVPYEFDLSRDRRRQLPLSEFQYPTYFGTECKKLEF